MKINSRQELYEYIRKLDFTSIKDTDLSSVYFLIKFDDTVWPIHFMHYEGSYFESPCQLCGVPLEDDKLTEFIQEMYGVNYAEEVYEFEAGMQRNGRHYEIENFQCAPFLPNEIEILDVFSDKKCLDWLLNHSANEQEGNNHE